MLTQTLLYSSRDPMKPIEQLYAVISFFADFCVNIAAGYFVAIFISTDVFTLTNRVLIFILSSYIGIFMKRLEKRYE